MTADSGAARTGSWLRWVQSVLALPDEPGTLARHRTHETTTGPPTKAERGRKNQLEHGPWDKGLPHAAAQGS